MKIGEPGLAGASGKTKSGPFPARQVAKRENSLKRERSPGEGASIVALAEPEPKPRSDVQPQNFLRLSCYADGTF